MLKNKAYKKDKQVKKSKVNEDKVSMASIETMVSQILEGKSPRKVLAGFYMKEEAETPAVEPEEELEVPNPELGGNPASDVVAAAIDAIPEEVETKEEVVDVLTDVAEFVSNLPAQPLETLVAAIDEFANEIYTDEELEEEVIAERLSAIIASYSKVYEEDGDEDIVDTDDASLLIQTVADNIPAEAETEEQIQEYLDEVADKLENCAPEDSIEAIQAASEETAEEIIDAPVEEPEAPVESKKAAKPKSKHFGFKKNK